MPKLVEIKNNPSFLQKFKDKKQVIDRQGLLKLLDMKRKQIQKSQEKFNSNPKALLKIKQDRISQAQSKRESENRKHKSKDCNKYTQRNENKDGVQKHTIHLNNSLKQPDKKKLQLRNNLKLPAINQSKLILRGIQKNQSQTLLSKRDVQNLIKKHHELQLQTQVSQISNTKAQKFQLSKDALQHLQLLNKFERLLIDTRLSNGQKSIVNLKIQ